MNITVTGTGMTAFGELWERSPRSLAHEAADAALRDAGRKIGDIDAVFVGNMLAGLLGNQQHAGALFAEELGCRGAAMTVEGACASGGLAVHAGILGILSGMYHRVLVLGVEKMTDHKPELVASALTAAGTSDERTAGSTFPGLYAMLARAHMETYKTTEEDLAGVAVKNHFHALKNAKAQFHVGLTVKQVMDSSYVADPLKLLDCSPITDGAAAIVLEAGKPGKTGVEIMASEVATDTLGIARRDSLTSLSATVRAGKRAFAGSGVSVADIDVAELHDCFTIAELLALEDLGFARVGKAAELVGSGAVTLGTAKRTVVNSSGGLKGCGHPVGATGVKQIVEIVDQLRGRCGERQVSGASIGLTQNVGGSGATAVVHILKTGGSK